MNVLPLLPATIVYSRRVASLRFYIPFLIVLVARNFAPIAHAQTKITVGYSAVAVSQVVPWIMQELQAHRFCGSKLARRAREGRFP
jgi:hypothetical protein